MEEPELRAAVQVIDHQLAALREERDRAARQGGMSHNVNRLDERIRSLEELRTKTIEGSRRARAAMERPAVTQRECEGDAYSGRLLVGRVRLVYGEVSHGGIKSWAGHIYLPQGEDSGVNLLDVDTIRMENGTTAQIVVTSGGGSGSPFQGNGPPPHQHIN